MSFALKHIATLTAGAVWAALSGEAAGAQLNGWTGPGWYVVDSSGAQARSAIRAGPVKDRATCGALRRTTDPPAPRGHPELDLLECRELLSPPLRNGDTGGARWVPSPVELRLGDFSQYFAAPSL